MSIQSLLLPTTKNENWAKLYVNEINTDTFNSDNFSTNNLTVTNNATIGNILTVVNDIGVQNDLIVQHDLEVDNTIQVSNSASASLPPVGFCKIFGGPSTLTIWPNPNNYRVGSGGGPINIATKTNLYVNCYFINNPNFTGFPAGVSFVGVAGPVGNMTITLRNDANYGIWNTSSSAITLNGNLNRNVVVSITACFDALSQGGPSFNRRFGLAIGNPYVLDFSSVINVNLPVTSVPITVQCISLLAAGQNYFIQLNVENTDGNVTGVQVTNLSYNIVEVG